MKMKKLAFLVLGLGIITAGYIEWNNATLATQEKNPTTHVAASVPAPGLGQKKVVLKNLGMT